MSRLIDSCALRCRCAVCLSVLQRVPASAGGDACGFGLGLAWPLPPCVRVARGWRLELPDDDDVQALPAGAASTARCYFKTRRRPRPRPPHAPCAPAACWHCWRKAQAACCFVCWPRHGWWLYARARAPQAVHDTRAAEGGTRGKRPWCRSSSSSGGGGSSGSCRVECAAAAAAVSRTSRSHATTIEARRAARQQWS